MRNLIVVLGDQLDRQSSAFDDFDEKQDAVWMREVAEESSKVWSHKVRIVMFLSAMRHFAAHLESRGLCLDYKRLDDRLNRGSLADELSVSLHKSKPRKIVVVEPGEYSVEQAIRQIASSNKVEIEIRPDRHFLCSKKEFAEHADGRKQLRMEFFYREQRKRHNILMDDGEPVGGRWNFDPENRGHFPKSGPKKLPRPLAFAPDKITHEVIALVNHKFGDHPGNSDHFSWPVTPDQAEHALDDFVSNRLPLFGQYQDAMWTGAPYLYHSLLSASMNLKLLDPRVAISFAETAYRDGHAPIEAVEGFIRQILGWREYVRGVYWLYMPDYLDRNQLRAKQPLPGFYWTAETQMNCLRQAIRQTLDYGYAHHIQRLMVTGLYALLLGVEPVEIHKWYLAVYVDAVEWVELPNTLGMSQYADGGVMASKPYVASGKYIQRMTNYCEKCAFNPAKSTEDNACPFTTLYWDFLLRHEKELKSNRRMAMQLKNLARLEGPLKTAIQKRANEIRRNGGQPKQIADHQPELIK